VSTINSQRPDFNVRRLQPQQISELVVASRDGNNLRVIYDSGELLEAPNWSPDGQWLIYNADGRLFKISPDGTDGPHRINTAPIENLNNDHIIAPDGKTLFVSANDGHLYAVPITGGTPQKVSNDHPPERGYRYFLHGISPDGKTLAYVGLERLPDGGKKTYIATIPVAGGADIYFTDGSCPVDGPEYSADGEWLYFNSEAAATQPGHAQLFRIRADGSQLQQLTFDNRVNWFPHPSPDGALMVYLSYPEDTLGHPADKNVIVRLANIDGKNALDIDQFNGGQGTINVNSWAPDSQQFAYVRYPLGSSPPG
jgi:Tol biopolymer transport system component